MSDQRNTDHCWPESYTFDEAMLKSIVELIGLENEPCIPTLLELVRDFRFFDGEDSEESPLRDVKREMSSLATLGEKLNKKLWSLSHTTRELIHSHGWSKDVQSNLYTDLKTNLKRLEIANLRIQQLEAHRGRPEARNRKEFIYRLAEWLEAECGVEASTSQKGVLLPLADKLLASLGQKNANLKEDIKLAVEKIRLEKGEN
jgi:hypothetical protein